jgi:hypothetical protein
MLLAALAIVAIPISMSAGCFESGAGTAAPSSPLARQVEERFAIQFCYAQYRSQSDVLRCLAQSM